MTGTLARGEERRKYIILAIVLTGVFMSVLDSVVVNIALPSITTNFLVKVSDSQWVITIYLVVQTSLLIFFGRIAEYTGKAKMFIMGLGLFTVSSFLCGISAGLDQLILFRIMQGIGASMLFSIAAAINFQTFSHQERGRVMGFLGSTVAGASMVGPVLGGFIVGALGWRYIFLINVPIGIVVFIAAFKMLKLEERCENCLRIDYPGAVLWITSVVTLMLFLGQVAGEGTISVVGGIYALLFAVLLIGFVLWEKRASLPMLDISVFRVRRFTLTGVSMMLFFTSSIMVTALGPFYFEGVLGYSPEQVGLIFMVLPAVLVFGAPITGKMYDKTHSKYYSPAGHLIRAVSLFLMAFAFVSTNLMLVLAAFFIMGVGSALFQSPNNTEVMVALPREKAGIASSMSATLRNLGMALGVSLGTILLTLQMGAVSVSNIEGGAGTSELASAVGIIMVVSGIISLAGAVLSLKGNTVGPGQ
ncbi:MAG TPA: DHA2 family efflux MFS transporter permease subunit [Methanomassiliicoccales archaeon]|jgi:EmrB/QacA subfamily drug resistance transporter